MKIITRIKQFTTQDIMPLLAAVALAMAAVGANQLCFYCYHQPEMPDKVRELSSISK